METNGQRLYKNARRLIPGGTQLLSKRPEMFAPKLWPSYYSKSKGCRIWDIDNNEYIDMSIMSVGACILGYADDEVDEAVVKAIKDGVSTSLNCKEEVELAEKLIELHPWFGMVRYSRSGGEAVSIAIRIARAYTNREVVLFSGYHGWNDWYLAANLADAGGLDGQLMPGLEPRGIPRGLTGTAIPFPHKDLDNIKKKIKGKEDTIAAIIVEPARGEMASSEYLGELKKFSEEIGAVLIFDEITSGFRVCAGGIHRKYSTKPDIAVIAKAMANGYAMAAVMGTESVMQAAQSTFISSTNWTERIGPVASIATINKYLRENVGDHVMECGKRVKNIWSDSANVHGIEITTSGIDSLPAFSFSNVQNTKEMNTLFTCLMLERGFLGFRQFKPSWAHKENELKSYEMAVGEVFSIMSQSDSMELLKTPVHHDGFKRLTKE